MLNFVKVNINIIDRYIDYINAIEMYCANPVCCANPFRGGRIITDQDKNGYPKRVTDFEMLQLQSADSLLYPSISQDMKS
jgi:hypothetical protein